MWIWENGGMIDSNMVIRDDENRTGETPVPLRGVYESYDNYTNLTSDFSAGWKFGNFRCFSDGLAPRRPLFSRQVALRRAKSSFLFLRTDHD